MLFRLFVVLFLQEAGNTAIYFATGIFMSVYVVFHMVVPYPRVEC